VGFLGVLVVTRPGAGSFQPAALLSLTAALCYALYSIATRVLARTDSNETTLFYSNIVGALALLPVVPFVWTTPSDPLVIALMVATGAMGSFGHYLLIAAHRLAPAAVLSPFIYTEIVLVTATGFLVFGDVPNRSTLTGAAIVVASGLYILHRERAVRRTKDQRSVVSNE
jgi:drug/metabolite transporter (DMT)-like permease